MGNITFDEALVLQCRDEEQLKTRLLLDQFTGYIRRLILNDFEKLVNLLYRIDVDENKLRQLLNDNANEDSAKTIAALIINRQIEKIKLKKTMRQSPESDEEKR